MYLYKESEKQKGEVQKMNSEHWFFGSNLFHLLKLSP